MKSLIKKIENQEEFKKWLIVGFSPLGVFVPGILLYIFKICEGGYDPGLTCKLSLFEFYPGIVMLFIEMCLWLFGLGLVWMALAVIIWLKILSYPIRVYLSKKPELSSILLKVRFVALAAALVTAVTLVLIFFLT